MSENVFNMTNMRINFRSIQSVCVVAQMASGHGRLSNGTRNHSFGLYQWEIKVCSTTKTIRIRFRTNGNSKTMNEKLSAIYKYWDMFAFRLYLPGYQLNRPCSFTFWRNFTCTGQMGKLKAQHTILISQPKSFSSMLSLSPLSSSFFIPWLSYFAGLARSSSYITHIIVPVFG